jgi:PKD repeat protein
MSREFTGDFSRGRFIAEMPQPQPVPKAEATMNTNAVSAQANDADCAETFLELNKYKLTTEEYTAFTGLLGKLGTTEGKPVDTFSVAQNIVFADFFLPYMCCSECAPISYILQEVVDDETEEPPSISAKPNIICSNDPTPVVLSVNPPKGKFNLTAITQINETTFQVLAKDLNIGDNVITYELNGETASTTITVLQAPDASFTFVTDEFKPGVVIFTSADQDPAGHKWDFGDGGSSTEVNPTHQYKVDGTQTFLVTHFIEATNKCSAKTTLPVTLTVQQASIKLSQDSICRNAKDPLSITVNPAGGDLSIAATKINDFTYQVFASSLPPGTVTISYTVNGQTVSAVLTVNPAPDAEFTPQQIFSVAGEVDFTSMADASSNHEWEFGDPNSGDNNKSTEANPKHIYNVGSASQDFNVTHTVTDKNGCISGISKKVTVKGKEVVTDKKAFCFAKEVPFETGSFTSIALLNEAQLKPLFEQFKFSIKDNVLVFDTDPDQVLTFEVDYLLKDGTSDTEKHVTITVLSVNSHFNLKANTAKKSVVFTALVKTAAKVHWEIDIRGRTPIVSDKNPFEVSQSVFDNLEAMVINLTVTESQDGTSCPETNKIPLTRSEFFDILGAPGGKDF